MLRPADILALTLIAASGAGGFLLGRSGVLPQVTVPFLATGRQAAVMEAGPLIGELAVPVVQGGRVQGYIVAELSAQVRGTVALSQLVPPLRAEAVEYLYTAAVTGRLVPGATDPARIEAELAERLSRAVPGGRLEALRLTKLYHQAVTQPDEG